ncbi:MAG: carboxypeptidase-like regulatory domain-containing protein [Flavobacteriaceae bacterium]
MRFHCIVFLLLFHTCILFAQNKTTISGTVLDEFDMPIANVHIKIEGISLGAITDANGTFKMENISEGAYKVIASFVGYKTQIQTIKVQANQKIKLSFSLQQDFQELEESVVIGESIKRKKEKTAQAVRVVDVKTAKLKTADLGDVIAQSEGVSLRKSGGLGSKAKFSLNGLTGNQIRFFMDGIPLKFNGYTFGVATVPVNLIDRVEIYKGVVPIQFGADALGGAVNLVSPKIYSGFSGSFSYQTGSFGTHRAAIRLNYLNKNTGLFFKGVSFYDYAKNNYKVDVEVADQEGQLIEVTVPRFHDAYKGYGIDFTIGVKNRPWARELSLKGFYTDYTKEIQHNNLMTGIPYGEVISFGKSIGTILTYRKTFDKIVLDAVFGYNHGERQFVDESTCVYDWFGNCILTKIVPGEIGSVLSSSSGASNQYTWNDNLFSRINVSWEPKEDHAINVTLAPTYTKQTGDEIYTDTFDALNARRNLFTWINGIEYNIDDLDGVFKNSFFIKNYVQHIASKENIPPNNDVEVIKRKVNYFGFGNGLNYRITTQFSTKLTYEYATRLPQSDELFGDGQFTLGNLDLKPERSHNVNLEFLFRKAPDYTSSNWQIHSNIFLRKVDDLILFVPSADRTNIYQNVFKANSTGVEISGKWSSKSDRLVFSANSTYQNFYNNSQEGLFEAFYRDRIPNTPYFFANGTATYSFNGIFKNNDKLSLFYNTRYINQFFRSWESAGLVAFKKEIPKQQLHGLGSTYTCKINNVKYAMTTEIQNITNEKNFDFLGVQKPGRAFYIKLITQF